MAPSLQSMSGVLPIFLQMIHKSTDWKDKIYRLYAKNYTTTSARLPSMAFYPEYLGMQMPIMQLFKVQNCNLNAQLLETASQESFID